MTIARLLYELRVAWCNLRGGCQMAPVDAGHIAATVIGPVDTMTESCPRCGRATMHLYPASD